MSGGMGGNYSGVTPAEAGVHPDGAPPARWWLRSIKMDSGLRRNDIAGVARKAWRLPPVPIPDVGAETAPGRIAGINRPIR